MQLSENERYRLLFAVYPAFVEALPTISEPTRPASPCTSGPARSATTLLQDNFITELRDEIKKIGITFNEGDALCELQDELLQDALNALHQILSLFESLVRDNVAKAFPECFESEVRFRIVVSYVYLGC